jgi:hypothetical protein
MNHIEIFNSNLNQNQNKRYERWTEYRAQIDNFLSPVLSDPSLEKNKALIIGCGNLDDLNLKTITGLFKKVTLTDIDLESVKKGVIQQEVSTTNLEYCRLELTGFEDSCFFDQLIQVIMECKNQSCIQKYIDDHLIQIEKYQFLKEHSYDLILISPIYTQLIYHQLLNITQTLRELGHDQDILKWLESYMLDLMPGVIERLNKNLLTILSPKGRLVVLSDIFQSQQGTEFDLLIKKAIQSKKEMDKVYQYYLDKYGYGLGDFGLYHLDELMRTINYRWIIWPFDLDVSMVVKIKAYNSK